MSFDTIEAADASGTDADNADTIGTSRSALPENCDPLFRDRFTDDS